MKILAIGDFHGKIPTKLKRKLKRVEFDVVLCVGDLYNTTLLRKLAFKYWDSDKKLEDIIGKTKLKRIELRSFKTAKPIIAFLSELKKPVYLIFGNEKKQKIKRKGISPMDRKIMQLNSYQLLALSGYRGVAEKGIIKPRKKGEQKKHQRTNRLWNIKLARLFKRVKNNKKAIILVHDPPRGCKLDKVRNKASPMNGKHMGDEYFAKYIKKYQPLLVVCGHMHENQGKCSIGKSLIINPGPAYGGKAAIIELEGKKIKRVKFLE